VDVSPDFRFRLPWGGSLPKVLQIHVLSLGHAEVGYFRAHWTCLEVSLRPVRWGGFLSEESQSKGHSIVLVLCEVQLFLNNGSRKPFISSATAAMLADVSTSHATKR
jgi:hypothetical protein